MTDYPRYDATKPPVDPKLMDDVVLQEVIANLTADLKDAKRMVYQLTEDIKTKKKLLAMYKSFWNVREEGRWSTGYQSRRYTLTLYQKNVPHLDVGVYSLGPFGELRVLPNPPRSYMERFWGDLYQWIITPGPYREPHYRVPTD